MAEPIISVRTPTGTVIASLLFHDGVYGPLRGGEESNIIPFRIYNNYGGLVAVNNATNVLIGVSSSDTIWAHGNAITEGDPCPFQITQTGGGQGGSSYSMGLSPTYSECGYNTGDAEWNQWDLETDGYGSDGTNSGIIYGQDSEGDPFNPAAYVGMSIYLVGPTVLARTTFAAYLAVQYDEEV